MIDIGNALAVIAVSFGFGIFWYEFLRRPQKDYFKLTAISLVGVLIGEATVSSGMAGGPTVYGLHPITALVASFASIYLQTAWVERKIWPWEIIADLGKLNEKFRSVPVPKVSLAAKDQEQSGSGESKTSKAA